MRFLKIPSPTSNVKRKKKAIHPVIEIIRNKNKRRFVFEASEMKRTFETS